MNIHNIQRYLALQGTTNISVHQQSNAETNKSSK